MPTNYVNSGGWKSITEIYAKVSGAWQKATEGWVKVSGSWKQFFSTGAKIASRVTILATPTSWGNTTTGPAIVGTNYSWSGEGAITLTYVFQKNTTNSTNDSTWIDCQSAQSITNPSTGSFNNVTYILPYEDFSYDNPKMYYRFKVTATIGTAVNTSVSTAIAVNYTLPLGKDGTLVVSRNNNTSYNYTVTGQGSWTGSPTSYIYQWMQSASPEDVATVISGATSSTLDASSYKLKYLVCNVKAINSVGTSLVYIYGTELLYNYYKKPEISTFTVSGGAGQITYNYNYTSDDPNKVLTISYTGTSSGSFTPSLTGGTYTLAAGTYDFTFKVQNTLVEGNNLSATATSNNITVSVGVTAPGAPQSVTSTDTGTGRAYNNGELTVSWTAPLSNGNATIDYYKVEYEYQDNVGVWNVLSSNWNGTSLSSSPWLSNAYVRFRVSAHNSAGYGTAFTQSSYTQVTTVPQVPTIGTAANNGANRPYNNGRADIGFTAGASGGKTVTSYTITSTPGNQTGTGTASPIAVTGLSSATPHTFTVFATNANGNSSVSSASNSVVITTVPQAPTIGTASRGSDASVLVAFTANATGGSAISSYVVATSPSASSLNTASGTTSPALASASFVEGQSYTFTIAAINANGTSLPSSSSNSAIIFLQRYAYNITFNNGGGSGSMTNQTGTASSFNIKSNTFTRLGYSFDGWATTSGGPTIYLNDELITLSASFTRTFYANWLRNSYNYSITFNANGGSGTMSQLTGTASSVTLTSNAYTRTGYVFNGWNTAANGTGTSYTNAQVIELYASTTITLYAQWYRTNPTGGSGSISGTTTQGQTLTLTKTDATATPSPTVSWVWQRNDGSGTDPWVTRQTNGLTYLLGSGDAGFTIRVVLTWTNGAGTNQVYTTTAVGPVTAIYWNVSYNANGGTGAPSATQIVQGATGLVSSTSPTRSGYTFNGWNTNASGTGTNYAANDLITPTADITLYAKWNLNQYFYNFTFYANGGTGTMSAISGTAASVTLPANTFTRTGYAFAGWNTVANGTGTSYTNQQVIALTASITPSLYAQWTVNAAPSGGALYWSASNVNIGQTIILGTVPGEWSPPPTSYDLRIVRGTQGVVIFETTVASSTDSGPLEYKVLAGDVGKYFKGFVTVTNSVGSGYAVSTELGPVPAAPLYSVTFNSTGATSGSPSVSSVTQSSSGGSVTLATIGTMVKSGYRFAGWSIDGGMYASGGTYTPPANVTATPIWIQQFTVTWAANGGTVSPASDTVDTGLSVTAPTPTRSGYTFFNWRYPASGGDPIFISAGGTYTPTGNITFTAIWTLVTPPATPTGLALTTSGAVSWTASTGSPTSYEIEFYTAQNGTGTGVTGPHYVTGISSSPYQLGSTGSTQYTSPNNYARVRVRAVNSGGPSAYTAWTPGSTTYT